MSAPKNGLRAVARNDEGAVPTLQLVGNGASRGSVEAAPRVVGGHAPKFVVVKSAAARSAIEATPQQCTARGAQDCAKRAIPAPARHFAAQ